MRSQYYKFKDKAILLRKSGKTYGEIKGMLNKNIPKSTLSVWFKKIKLTKKQQAKIERNVENKIYYARIKALATNKKNRKQYLKSVVDRIKHLGKNTKNKSIAKIIVAMLYLGEGSKTQRGSLMFCNSNPLIIGLFLNLLRYCYNINEGKFRCTIQCRADQNIKDLEDFWPKITRIPSSQFYATKIDSRTIGKPSKKLNYKGVCRIDYFSADLYTELIKIPEIIYKESFFDKSNDGPVV